VGFKPTYGALSRYGLISYASSLDQVGVVARDVGLARRAFHAMRGPDPLDPTSREPGPAPAVTGRVAVLRELAGEGMSRDALAGLARARSALGEAGVEVVEASVPEVRYAVAAYYLIATAEAASNLSRYDGSTYGARVGEPGEGHARVSARTRSALFGAEVKRRVLMGSFALSAGYRDAYYGRAVRARGLVAAGLARALAGADALLTPTAVSTASRVGEPGEGHARVSARTRSALFGAEVKRRVLMGSFALSAGYRDAYYGRAVRARGLVAAGLARALAGADALLTPTAVSTAYRLG